MKARGHILTREERDVLILAAKHPHGLHLNNSDIGQRLGISANRVKTLIHQACVKLRAHNRNEALLFSIKRGEIGFNELYSLDELAEFLWALRPDILRGLAHLMHKGLEHGHLQGKDKQIIHTDRIQGTILTKSERDVLILVGRGLTNREIADTLYVSIGAVSTYLYRACTKLGVRKRADAVVLALKRREISICEIHALDELLQLLVPLGAESLEKIAQLLTKKLEQEPVPTGS